MSCCLYFLRYLETCVLYNYRVCYVIHFEIYISFLIMPFSGMIKKSEQKFKYLKNEKGF